MSAWWSPAVKSFQRNEHLAYPGRTRSEGITILASTAQPKAKLRDIWPSLINQAEGPPLDEAGFHGRWGDQVAGETDLALMAARGGALADRLAWVFIAGYQSALRHTFGPICSGWMAYAASEDRKQVPRLPGVSIERAGSDGLLSGNKTWVACYRHVEQIIIKVGQGTKAQYFCVPRGAPGLTLTGNTGRFLADMGQGTASLQQVLAGSPLDSAEVHQFRLREPLYIYLAFCAFAAVRGKGIVSPERCLETAIPIKGLLAEPVGAGLAAADAAVQSLLDQLASEAAFQSGPDWEADQRLIRMYSPGLQSG